LPSPTIVPEAFGDTPIVNGTVFPYIELPPTAVRFRILNACNDRFFNLQLFKSEPLKVRVVNGGTGYVFPVVSLTGGGASVQGTATATVVGGVITAINVTGTGTGYTSAPTVTITDHVPGGSDAVLSPTVNGAGTIIAIAVTSGGSGYSSASTVTITDPGTPTIIAQATATIGAGGAITAVTITNPGMGYTTPTAGITDPGLPGGTGAAAYASAGTEVKMVPALANPAYPTWPSDGRPGGVPDPTTMGPNWYLVGNEGGFLGQVQTIPPQPIDFDYNRRSVTIMGMTSKSLFIPSAVRADVVVDLSSYADGDTLILYNDSPAPAPLFDPRNDTFTDDPDQTAVGGPPTTAPGFGPNTRTIMQIRIKATAPAQPAWAGLAALQAALPVAFAAGQDPIIVPNSLYNGPYNTTPTATDKYVNGLDETLHLGAASGVAKVMVTLPGQNYTTPPNVVFVGGGGTGAAATAGLNGVTAITLTLGGSGYTTAPAVTIAAPGAGGIQATAAAQITGGVVTGVTITNPGSNYTLAPIVTIAAPAGAGGVTATATAAITTGSVGAITVTAPGVGYTKAPYVYLIGGVGGANSGAMAVAMLTGDVVLDGKAITEGFDREFGRMNAQLGSIPNPLTPLNGLGPVIGLSQYIDPPTEIITPDPVIPYLWRISHIGVDSHAVHFHLFDVQVINRVDWTGVIKPPYPEEIGWKETIRTNPFEDVIVAFRPTKAAMKLPFGLPRSSRLLDVTTPAGSTANFLPVLPPPGVAAAAQLSNIVTDFGWEYVWHCHLLGHEENDMMRPIVFDVLSTLPTAPVLTVNGTGGANLTWTDPTPYNYATGLPVSTLGNPMNEIGFRIMRATGGNRRGGGGTLTQIGTALANQTTYKDTTAVAGTTYQYQVVIYNAAGTRNSNTVSVTPTALPPGLPTAVTVTTAAFSASRDSVTLTWTSPTSNNQTGYTIQMATNTGFTQGRITGTANATATTWTTNRARLATTYYVRIQSTNRAGASAWVNATPFPITTP